MLFQCAVTRFRRKTEHDLAFRHRLPAHARADLELPQLAHLREPLGPEQNLLLRPNSREKFHRSNRGEEKERTCVLREAGCGGNSGSLRERLGQNYAGDKRIARKMSGKHWIVAPEKGGALGAQARLTVEHLPDEDEWCSMWQLGEVISNRPQVNASVRGATIYRSRSVIHFLPTH
jgi:hypothetical protein